MYIPFFSNQRGVDKISRGTIFQKESTVAAVKISKVSVSPLHNFFLLQVPFV